jgi:lipoate---protein ligase
VAGAGRSGDWVLERWREDPRAFHGRPLPDRVTRQVWICEPTIPALVLGSAQREDVVDRAACQRAGVVVARRRSGGGAVLVRPGGQLWLDVLLPADDPLWTVDVGRAFLWLGEAWAAALGALGVEASVHRSGVVRTAWSDLVCFGGLGTGEVVDGAGVKLVGLSQRRTRAGARFQCVVLERWDPAELLDLLALDPAGRQAGVAELGAAARGPGVGLAALEAGLLAALP